MPKNAQWRVQMAVCSLKETHIRRKIVKKKTTYMWNQYYYYFKLPEIRVGWVHTTKNSVTLSNNDKNNKIIKFMAIMYYNNNNNCTKIKIHDTNNNIKITNKWNNDNKN